MLLAQKVLSDFQRRTSTDMSQIISQNRNGRNVAKYNKL